MKTNVKLVDFAETVSMSSSSFNCQSSSKVCPSSTVSPIGIYTASLNNTNDFEIISESCLVSKIPENSVYRKETLQHPRLRGCQKDLDRSRSNSCKERQDQSQNNVWQDRNQGFSKEMNTTQKQSRRVSFRDTVIEGDHCCRTIMQNDYHAAKSYRDDDRPVIEMQEILCDIWQADDLADRSDDGYENTLIGSNYSEKHVSDYTSNRDQDSPEDVDEILGHTRGRWTSKCDVPPVDCVAEDKARNDENDTLSNENILQPIHKDVNPASYNKYRMRGGCGGCCKASRESSQDRACERSRCCEGSADLNESCSPREEEPCRDGVKTACTTNAACTQLRCCCSKGCRAVRKKATMCVPPCTTGARGCGNGECCGCGCRDGCGKPGQTCIPLRVCTSPGHRLHSSYGKSPYVRACPCLQSPCSSADRISGYSSNCSECCCGGSYECKSSQSLRHRTTIDSGNYVNDGTKCCTDGAIGTCWRLKSPTGCECLGGGLDCQRCRRKVYQAEMQIASGVPYHSICFSCFCCRKPLEPLTYQENCGEIYCKQCYVRNFGPQGYGYGVGAGVLQTPL